LIGYFFHNDSLQKMRKNQQLFKQFLNKFKIKMPGGGLPGVGRFTMGGKHNESWFKLNRLLGKKQVIFYYFLKKI